MSSDIKPILTKDSRISELTSQLPVSAFIGSKNNSFYQYDATTASASSINITCALPSESVIFDRLVFMGATVNFEITYVLPAGSTYGLNKRLFSYGRDCCFQPMALNGLMQNTAVKLNGVSVSQAQDDLQNVLLRTQDINQLMQSNMVMSPIYCDNYLEYKEAQGEQGVAGGLAKGFSNNVFNSYPQSHFSSILPRGAHPISNVKYFIDGVAVPAQADFKVGDQVAQHTYKVQFSATFFEPLMTSPFQFSSKKYAKMGLTNIQTMNFNFSVDTTLRNVWSQLPIAGLIGAANHTYSIALQAKAFDQFAIYVNCLTPHITDIIPPVTLLPCIRYETFTSGPANLTPLPSGDTADLTINNIVFNQIPEMIYICARKIRTDTTYLDAKSFLTINSASCTFGNSQGMLSSMSQQLLWKMSKENGIALNWYEWSGKANQTVYTSATDVVQSDVFLTGSIIAINPSKDLGLSSPYLSNGSKGGVNFQMKLNVRNNYTAAFTPEVLVIVKYGCYMRNKPGGFSEMKEGYFDMQILSDLVTKSDTQVINSADLNEIQGNGLDDQKIGGLNDVAAYNLSESGRSGGSRSGSGRVGGSRGPMRKGLNKICI